MLDEEDYCMGCGALLRTPPDCCEEAMNNWEEDYGPPKAKSEGLRLVEAWFEHIDD